MSEEYGLHSNFKCPACGAAVWDRGELCRACVARGTHYEDQKLVIVGNKDVVFTTGSEEADDQVTFTVKDSPFVAAKDCAVAKMKMDKAKEYRQEMENAKERLLAFEYEKLDDPDFKHLVYPVGVLEPGHPPKRLELRRTVNVAKGRIYSPENQKRYEELQKTMKALVEEMQNVPYTAENHEVVSWSVWLVTDEPPATKVE